ncbi:arginine decarboxylase [Orenia metallireducens]|jgi:arginine/lysine/ornithine decarboxylase|uniref:Arginine decarboxylase n=1 Tax=Orenia metallireducens TaxID=1413210 RepID=A0A285HFL2_9FIRM|nr:aminotransferase class I/II-fold pyridoxal phosphate-dependent enzyme [Orenia metallireducens]PRX27701.1 arginine decarboxylase [Orenia metallireducens]SNY33501.1 arginine decarboxylase [Orenia metallireducens]
MELDQSRTPLFSAIKMIEAKGITPFDVPGHKRGKGLKELKEHLGEQVFEMDINAMVELDNIFNPSGVIKEAEELAADLYGAEKSFFLVNGTTSGLQTMIMTLCKTGKKIILPRNVHRSITAGLILSGAVPIYLKPEYNNQLGIAMGVTPENVEKTIKENPETEVLLLTNPTYYGVTSNIKKIIEIAHSHGLYVIVDQAHGSHFRFHKDLPLCALEAGADMIAMSLHKTGGSLTQSSLLMVNNKSIDADIVRTYLNLIQTTSPSHILLSSIDVARKQLALEGNKLLEQVLEVSRYAREKINNLESFYAFGPDLLGNAGVFAFDESKLGIYVKELGLTGYEVRDILYYEYNIQIEMADLYNILCIISLGDDYKSIDRLINALEDIKEKHCKAAYDQFFEKELIIPEVIVSPRDAFYSRKKVVNLEDSIGEISGESVMAYPPGIPIIAPGERITEEIIEYINLLKEQNSSMQGPVDPLLNQIRVLGF